MTPISPVNSPLPTQQIPYPVLVERQADGYWVAQIPGWGECVAKAPGRAEAIATLQTMVNDRLAHAEVIYLEIPKPQIEHPLMQYVGMFKDDPQFDQVVAEIATYRYELDAERDELQDPHACE